MSWQELRQHLIDTRNTNISPYDLASFGLPGSGVGPDQFAWTREIWNPDEPWTWRRLFANGVFRNRQQLHHFLLELFLPHAGPMEVEVLGREAPYNKGKVVDVINDRSMIVEMLYPNDEGEIIVNPFNVIPLLS